MQHQCVIISRRDPIESRIAALEIVVLQLVAGLESDAVDRALLVLASLRANATTHLDEAPEGADRPTERCLVELTGNMMGASPENAD